MRFYGESELFFFLPKKSTSSWHTNVSFELGPVIWFLCVNIKIQCKDNVLKSSEVELHWLLALLSPSEAPTLFPWTLSSHRSTQSWDTSPSYSPIKTFVECLLHPWLCAPWWLSGGTVAGSFPHRVYNLKGHKTTGIQMIANTQKERNNFCERGCSGVEGNRKEGWNSGGCSQRKQCLGWDPKDKR